ncbi:MAG: oligosaccharide flippase family protein [Candidatus Lokiarchaeota archaeon]
MFSELYGLIKKYRKHGENFVWRAIQNIGKMVLDLIVFYIVVRILTPEKYGQYSYLIALVGLFVTFGNFGLSTSVSKYTAEYQLKDRNKIKSILFSSLVLSSIFCFLVSIVIIIFGSFFFPEYYEFLGYLIALIFLISFSNILDGVYRGLMRFKKLTLLSILTFIVRKEKGIIFDKKIAVIVFKYALVLGITGLAYFLYTNIDILFLEHYGYIIEIGDFKIVNRFIELTFIPFVVLGQVIAPAITHLVTRKDFGKLRKYTVKLPYFFGLGILISIFSYFAFPILVQIFFPEYYSTNILLIWNLLLLLIPFKCVGAIISQAFLIPAGLGRISMNLTILGGLLNVFFDFLFIQWFGFLGVFYATLIIHSLTNVLSFLLLYKKVSVKWHNPATFIQKVMRFCFYKFIILHYYFYKNKLNFKLNKIMSFNKENLNLESSDQEERALPGFSKHKNSGYFKYMLSRYLLSINFIKNKIVLDSACGFGWGSYLISDYPKKLISIDRDIYVINICKKVWNDNKIIFKRHDILDLDSLETNFDVILGMEIIEHLNLKDGIRYLKQCFNNLSKKGIIILSSYFPKSVPYANNESLDNVYHQRIYSKEELRKIVTSIGYSKIIFLSNLIALIRK